MSKDYFPNPGWCCFGSSLANLLVELGDIAKAEAVFRNYRDNSLVLPNGGMSPLTATRLVSELTNQKYEGTLTADVSDVTERLRDVYKERTDEILRIFNEETEKGRIKGHNGSIKFTTPAILFVDSDVPGANHCMVIIEDGKYISYGELEEGSIEEMMVTGVLEVELSNLDQILQ